MKIVRHECPYSTEEIFKIFPGPGNGILHIKRLKEIDYYVEFLNSEGKIIISCNYPSYINSKTFDLSKYSDNEYTLRLTNTDGEGVCLYRVFKY